MLPQVGLVKKPEEVSIVMIHSETPVFTYKNIRVETAEAGIRILTIARPNALNALNMETLLEMREALTLESNNPSTRVLILTGDGTKSFIAGADIVEMKDKSVPDGVHFSQVGHAVSKLLSLMPKATIAAVNGFALGGGAEMALSCDFIVASENAVFGLPEVSLGVIPGFGGTFRLAKAVGLPRAKELIFSGRRIKADEASKIGFVNHIFPVEGFMPKVIEIARAINQQSATALAQAKRLLNDFSETSGLNSKLDAEAMTFGQLFGTVDQLEGMAAFVEKRKAAFQGIVSPY
jgi:enoyl-CoA hydratase